MKTNKIGRFFAAALLFAAVSFIVPNIHLTKADTETTNSKENISSADMGTQIESSKSNVTEDLKVYYIDIGQGDATLITCGKEAMLIDCGDNDKGTRLQLFLKKQGVESLKYLIGTHMDSDHIGGMDVILTKFDCDTVMYPESEKDSTSYWDVIDAMDYRHYKNTVPEVGKIYQFGDAEFTIISPNTSYKDNDNNSSIGLILKHGDNKFLFTGDAEREGEENILRTDIDISCDVYKAGHHGSSSSTTDDLLEAANPSYAVISSGADNPYGHPDAETLDKLEARNISIYRTDSQGTILAVSDGSQIEIGPLEKVPFSVAYVLNKKSNKFHIPTCDKLPMYNREDVNLSRKEVTEAGYTPCKRCKP